MIYSLHLAGEVLATGFSMQVDRDELLAAVGGRRAKARLGRVALVVCEEGLSVRSMLKRSEVAGIGFWASPIAVEAWRVRRALVGQPRGAVHLEYWEKRLTLNGRSMPAREI
jgi:hypothetical protein